MTQIPEAQLEEQAESFGKLSRQKKRRINQDLPTDDIDGVDDSSEELIGGCDSSSEGGITSPSPLSRPNSDSPLTSKFKAIPKLKLNFCQANDQ